MKLEQLKDFCGCVDSYFEKKHEIARLINELNILNTDASDALNASIDNGFALEQLTSARSGYEEHGFASPYVKTLLDDVCKMFLRGVPDNAKRGLEVIALDIPYRSCYGYDTVTVGSSFYVSFLDVKKKISFDISIPVKDAILYVDIDKWYNNHIGLYTVTVSMLEGKVYKKEICKAFDKSKANEAIVKLLSGGFDDEIDSDCVVVQKEAAFNEDMWGKNIPYEFKHIYDDYDISINHITSLIDDRAEVFKMTNNSQKNSSR